MHNTSDLYKTILADETHENEVKVIIDGVEYLHDRLISVSTESCLISTNGPGIGCAVSRQIDMEFYPDGIIPDAARVELYVRLPSCDLGVSEWIPQGVFFIDTREPDNDCGTLKIHGYDCLTAYANDLYIPEEGGETGEWPRTMRSVAEDIATLLNTNLDDRCVFNDDLIMEYPIRVSPHTCRHFFAQQQVKMGTDLYTISRLLGHENIGITQTYLNSLRDEEVIQIAKQRSVLQSL